MHNGKGPAPAGESSPSERREEHQLLTVLVQAQGDALERVLGVIRRRAAAHSEIHIATAHDRDSIRVAVTLRGTPEQAEQLATHLRNQVAVRSATALPLSDHSAVVQRELALVRIACTPESRETLANVAQLFSARVADAGESSLTLEASGAPEMIDQMLGFLRPLGVVEVARTGRAALARSALHARTGHGGAPNST
jgi:acetolactate synthase-1/3 small subunit